jgi:hypothetical protein
MLRGLTVELTALTKGRMWLGSMGTLPQTRSSSGSIHIVSKGVFVILKLLLLVVVVVVMMGSVKLGKPSSWVAILKQAAGQLHVLVGTIPPCFASVTQVMLLVLRYCQTRQLQLYPAP